MTLYGRITHLLFWIDENVNHRFFRWVTRGSIDEAVASKRFCDWVDKRLWLGFYDETDDHKWPDP